MEESTTHELSGRDADLFVQAVDQELLCSICHNVFFDALDTPCGHTFCAPCIRRALSFKHNAPQSSKGGPCPKCRATITYEEQLKPVNYTLRNIMGRMITRCDHFSTNESKPGCAWQGEWSQLSSHLKTDCQHQPVSCPFAEYGCSSKPIPRALLSDHLSATALASSHHFEVLAQTISSLTARLHASEQTIEKLQQDFAAFRTNSGSSTSVSASGASDSTRLPPPKYGCFSHTIELVDFPPRNRPLEFHLGGFTWGLFFIEGAVAYAPFIRLVALHPPHQNIASITVEWRVVLKGNKPNSNPVSWTITKDVFRIGTAWGPKTGCKTEQEFMDKAGVDLTLDMPFKVSLKLYIHPSEQ